MKIYCLLGILLCLGGCDPVPANQLQQQTFICKSLIEGYLQARHLGQFKLWSQEQHPQTMQPIQYIYRQPVVGGMVLGITQQLEMKFYCQEKTSHSYVVEWLDPGRQHKAQILKVTLPHAKLTSNVQASAPGTR